MSSSQKLSFDDYIPSLLTEWLIYPEMDADLRIEMKTRIDQFTSAANMVTWRRAFTAVSYDSDNYETLEFIGDKVLGSTFSTYLINSDALTTGAWSGVKINQAVLTKLFAKYMSKEYQAALSEKYNMPDYIYSQNTTISVDEKEDVFESFFGALQQISLDIDGDPSIASKMAYIAIETIFGDVTFDVSVISGDYKTRVKELIDKMRWGNPAERGDMLTTWDREEKVLRFTLNDKAIDFFSKRRTPITAPILYEVRDRSRQVAEDILYQRVFEKLGRMGITQEFAERYARDTPQRLEALKKAKRAGYSDIKLVPSKTPDGSVLYTLYGIKGNREIKLLDKLTRGSPNELYIEYITLK